MLQDMPDFGQMGHILGISGALYFILNVFNSIGLPDYMMSLK